MNETPPPHKNIANPHKINILQLIKDAKEVVAIAVFFILTVVSFFQFVATKKDIEILSCKINAQFQLSQLYMKKTNEESRLKGLNKEATGIFLQLSRGVIIPAEYSTQRANDIDAQQKEAENEIKSLQQQIDQIIPIGVATPCEK